MQPTRAGVHTERWACPPYFWKAVTWGWTQAWPSGGGDGGGGLGGQRHGGEPATRGVLPHRPWGQSASTDVPLSYMVAPERQGFH